MKKSNKKILLLCFSLVLYLSFSGMAFAAGEAEVGPSVDTIETIQAYTDTSFYGQKLTEVVITYQDNVNLTDVSVDTYSLLDRGYANPDFAEVVIDSVKVCDQVVTLYITVDTEALENNTFIYAGDDAAGSRTKNPLGLYATGPWYRDVKGVIHANGEGYAEPETGEGGMGGEGYQTRECLELKLYHTGETVDDAASLANDDGSYNADGLWLPTIDANYGDGGFQTFEELGIEVPTTATDGEKFVRGWAYFPPEYEKNNGVLYPLIVTITGYGTSFWRLPDGTNNFGTGLNFDASGFAWMDCGAIVLNIHDRSHTGGEDYKFWVDDYNVIQFFIENYNADPKAITLTGNSRGTIAVQTIVSTYPGLINTLILNNGFMGGGIAGRGMFDGPWTDVEWGNATTYGLSIWAFDGEQDTDNIAPYKTAIQYYKAAGWSDEWIEDNIRLTGYPSNLFYYWGDTDHSATKMTYWYFFDKPYYGPDCDIVNGELVYNKRLRPGDTYNIRGKLSDGTYNKDGFEYLVYGENLRDWVLSRKYETR